MADTPPPLTDEDYHALENLRDTWKGVDTLVGELPTCGYPAPALARILARLDYLEAAFTVFGEEPAMSDWETAAHHRIRSLQNQVAALTEREGK